MRSPVGIALAALGALLLAAPCGAVVCGDVITRPEKLTGNLTCTTNPGVDVQQGGSLDLNGFTLACNGTQVGVALSGVGAKLSNGVVTGCATAGVEATSSRHKIRQVLVSDGGTGFHLTGSFNKIDDCVASNNDSFGFDVDAGNNSLRRVVANGNRANAIDMVGDGQKLADVFVVGSGDPNRIGIAIIANDSQILRARIADVDTSVSIIGSGNKLLEVTSLDSEQAGLLIDQDDNQARKCVVLAAPTAEAGVKLYGSDSSISDCRVLGSENGIRIAGDRNMVSKNRIYGSHFFALGLAGVDNLITGNLAVDSGDEALEDLLACALPNTWTKNVGKHDEPCIE